MVSFERRPRMQRAILHARGIVPDWYFVPLAMLILVLLHRLSIKAQSCQPLPNRVS